MISDIVTTLDSAVINQLNIDVQTANTHFVPELLTPWARTTLLPSETVNLTRGDNPMIRINGLYQIDVFYPSGSGYQEANAETRKLLDYFYNNRTLPIDNTTYEVQLVNIWEDISTQEDDWYAARLTMRFETLYKT